MSLLSKPVLRKHSLRQHEEETLRGPRFRKEAILIRVTKESVITNLFPSITVYYMAKKCNYVTGIHYEVYSLINTHMHMFTQYLIMNHSIHN